MKFAYVKPAQHLGEKGNHLKGEQNHPGESGQSSPQRERVTGQGARSDGRLAENIVYFARALRAAGIPVGPGAVLDALERSRPPASARARISTGPCMRCS